ncbi:MAPK/MAK/MRK overlapping kinase, partial [Chiroxiphia lanceolata]|uniref:MAPK/MAK/MRK overlapping kinase n=1 Tax=Chiroxiphia lanceolata TaxID=296741 RepID=UPI0013CE9021
QRGRGGSGCSPARPGTCGTARDEQIPVGKIGEGAFSDVLQTLSLRNGKYYACKHRKQHFERVHEALIRSGLALSSSYGSFLGSDELEQISKIHIIGTLAKTTLKKFKHILLGKSRKKKHKQQNKMDLLLEISQNEILLE